MEVQENISKLFSHPLSPPLPAISKPRHPSPPLLLSSSFFAVAANFSRENGRKTKKFAMIYHRRLRRGALPRPRRTTASAAVAEKERKTCALMNQNDIGRQHHQTYNFSPSLSPALSLFQPSLSSRALVCVCVASRPPRVGQPTEGRRGEFAAKAALKYCQHFRPCSCSLASPWSVQNSAITAAAADGKGTRDEEEDTDDDGRGT